MTDVAQQTFEIENDVKTIPPNDDVYSYNIDQQKALRNEAPWKNDAKFFKRARISAVALVKMVTHARSGGAIEVMGLMQGKVTHDGEIIVVDAFALPVEGTETRVNAGAEAYEYMIQYDESSKTIGRPENVVGWYHSHPGYGCWLSGIDVGTQKENQLYQDPFLAVVIDPNRTISAGSVEIGAFRTLPAEYVKSNSEGPSEFQHIPLGKIEDFGVHADSYYPLEVSYFKSPLETKLLEALWNKYWVTTLSQSSLVLNRSYTTERLSDFTQKVAKYNKELGRTRGFRKGRNQPYDMTTSPMRTSNNDGESRKPKKPLSELEKLSREIVGVGSEEEHGLLGQKLKEKLFNCRLTT